MARGPLAVPPLAARAHHRTRANLRLPSCRFSQLSQRFLSIVEPERPLGVFRNRRGELWLGSRPGWPRKQCRTKAKSTKFSFLSVKLLPTWNTPSRNLCLNRRRHETKQAKFPLPCFIRRRAPVGTHKTTSGLCTWFIQARRMLWASRHAGDPWLVIVRSGRDLLIDTASVEAAYERLLHGEQPPLMPSERRSADRTT